MRLRLEELPSGAPTLAVLRDAHWVPLVPLLDLLGTDSPDLRPGASDMIALLSGGSSAHDEVLRWLETDAAASPELTKRPEPRVLLPFQPLSCRDFMLYEQHVVNAGRGYAKRFLPKLWPVLSLYERILRKPHPKLRPKPLWYEHPIYYMGSHINVFTDGDTIPWPHYCSALDYELELGVVVAQPLFNATPEQAAAAIGGFVVFNDFSARDGQLAEMTSGFGPVKSKNFANGIGPVVAEARDILPRIDDLTVTVEINGENVATGSTAGMHYSVGEMVAYASRGERVLPGELMGTGTIPGCCALENGHWLRPDDTITIGIEGVGSLTNRIGRPDAGPNAP